MGIWIGIVADAIVVLLISLVLIVPVHIYIFLMQAHMILYRRASSGLLTESSRRSEELALLG